MIGQIWDTCGSRGSPLPRIFVHSIKNQAKINMGLMGESTQNRRKNQNLRTPSRRVANPSFWIQIENSNFICSDRETNYYE